MGVKSKAHEIKRERKKALFLREVSTLIQKISEDEPAVRNVYVTRVELSADTGICYVYFSCYVDKADFKEALDVLKLYKPSMRSFLAKSLSLRYAPNLVFLYDEKKEKIQKIDQLLDEVHQELEDAPVDSENSGDSEEK